MSFPARTPASRVYRSPLHYPGGKSRGADQIIAEFPRSVWREGRMCSPFLGGASIEIALAASSIRVYGGDADPRLVGFWRHWLKDAKQLYYIVRSRYYPMTLELFNKIKEQIRDIPDTADRAAMFYVVNRASFSGSTFSGGMLRSCNRLTPSIMAKGLLLNTDLPMLSVECLDWRDSIAKHPDCFLYLDPPYPGMCDKTMELYGYWGDLQRDFDHDALFDLLKDRRNWIMSNNDCPENHERYAGFHKITPKWKYGIQKKESSELLIFSRDLGAR